MQDIPVLSCLISFLANEKVLLVIAALLCFFVLRAFLSAVWYLVRPAKNVRKYGEWAVVTGATDGIGLAIASELARKGMKIVLIGRDQTKLEDCAKQISSRYTQTEVKIVKADMSSEDPNLYNKIGDEIRDLDVGVLFNNVGLSYPHPEYLHSIDDALVSNILSLNVVAATKMTKLVLPGMVQRKRGAIINIGSAAGSIPTGDPLLSVYSATKAYVDFFSRALYYELMSKGVHVQCQIPYFVVSKMSKIRKPTLFIPTPERFAKSAVASIGHGPQIVPYAPHALQHVIINALPEWLLSRYLLSHHHSLRTRALNKKDK